MKDIGVRKNSEIIDPYTKEVASYLFTATDNRGVAGEFDYYRGSNNHIFIGAIPRDLGAHYATGYQPIPASEAELALAAKQDAYRLDVVKALVPGGRFLEIGPWIGMTAYSALKSGYDVSTLEMDPRCVALMNSVGIHATQTDDPGRTLVESGEKYDVIGLWHSIEHIPEPWNVIDAAAKAIRPGGILVIAAPNPDSAQLRATGKLWYGLDAPRHLHLMPAEHYQEIGERNGLQLVERTTDDRLGRILERVGWNFELERRFRNIVGLRSLVRLPLWRILSKRHRRRNTFDGAAYTLIMRRPPG